MACQYLKRQGKPTLAYHYSPPSADQTLPTVCFLGGFKSDMNGTKATFLEKQCQQRGQGFLRFDYTGHGESDGKFEDGTIGKWTGDALEMLEHINPASVILVGSSMGGWISLLVAQKRADIIAGLIGIAAAPDFTIDLWEQKLSESQRNQVLEKGFVAIDNDYSDEPYIFTKALFDDGRENCVLNGRQKIAFPVSLIQGMLDMDVPWETTAKIQSAYDGTEIDILLIEDGDHRLSRPEDLDIIDREIINISKFREE